MSKEIDPEITEIVEVYFKHERRHVEIPCTKLYSGRNVAREALTEYVCVPRKDGSEEYLPASEVQSVIVRPVKKS